MPWDADSAENEYIDYLAEHESGFMGEEPVRLVSVEDELRRIVLNAPVRTLRPKTKKETKP